MYLPSDVGAACERIDGIVRRTPPEHPCPFSDATGAFDRRRATNRNGIHSGVGITTGTGEAVVVALQHLLERSTA